MNRHFITFAFLVATLAAGTLACFQYTYGQTPLSRSARPLVVLSYGGAFEKAQRAAFFDPFTRQSGIPVVSASYGGEYGKLKATVQAAESSRQPVEYDVVDIESSALVRGTREGIFVPIDSAKVDTANMIPEAVNTYGIATDLYSVSLGWSTKAFPASRPQPASWTDFWDVKRFPGPRALKKDAKFTLEIALLADGVPRDKIYVGGMDVDRAFRSLDRIKPHVKVWWTTGQQPIQLLADGEVVMAAAFGARLFSAERTDKRPLRMTWNDGVLDLEYWAILKGARDPVLSMRFISFASQAQQQAELPKHLPLGPVNTKAFDLLPPKLKNELNTSPKNYRRQLLLNVEFWGDHDAELQEKFNRWLGQ